MPLHSQMFKYDEKLQFCLIKDQSHILRGAVGDHVGRIQSALMIIDNLIIDDEEIRNKTYGPSTERAVLAYKTKRKIINHAYQSKPDAIVGKMTINSLDCDIVKFEMAARVANACSGKRKPSNV